MSSMKVTLGYKSDKEYYAVNEYGNRIEIDMLDGDQKKAQSPMQLLLSAIVSCAAVDIVSMVKKRRKTLIGFSGEAEGIRREEHPRRFTDIAVKFSFTSPDLTDEEAERIVHLGVEKYCSVAGTIDKETRMTHTFQIIRPV